MCARNFIAFIWCVFELGVRKIRAKTSETETAQRSRVDAECQARLESVCTGFFMGCRVYTHFKPQKLTINHVSFFIAIWRVYCFLSFSLSSFLERMRSKKNDKILLDVKFM